MKKNDVIVRQSKIHGKGAFAGRDFKKGEVVIKYNLKKLTKKEFDNLSEKEKHYTSKEDGNYFLFSSPERYVNHSCNPNTNPINKCDIAIKDIKKDINAKTFKKQN